MVRLRIIGLVMLMAVAAQPGRAAQPPKLKPVGNPGDWITPDDYPPAALRAYRTGSSGFRLSIDTAGHVTGCSITKSSGSADLDEATCKLLSARASFAPAMGRNGQAVSGTFSSSVHWQIPLGDSDTNKQAQAGTMMNCDMEPGDIHVVTMSGCL